MNTTRSAMVTAWSAMRYHEYSFAGLGLDPDAERARFARYVDRFAVPVGAVS